MIFLISITNSIYRFALENQDFADNDQKHKNQKAIPTANCFKHLTILINYINNQLHSTVSDPINAQGV